MNSFKGVFVLVRAFCVKSERPPDILRELLNPVRRLPWAFVLSVSVHRRRGGEKGREIEYADLQKKAIHYGTYRGYACSDGRRITGKTTTLNAIIKMQLKVKQNGKTVLLSAPQAELLNEVSELTAMRQKLSAVASWELT